jgi:hypothetical protein
MVAYKHSRFWLGVAVAILVGRSAAADHITFTQVGTPTWQAVDSHLFSAPIGTSATGFVEFSRTLDALLPPPNHIRRPGAGISPGAPHPGPYDRELAEGIARLGFTEKMVFNVSEFSAPNGVYFATMFVPAPGAPIGSSPDFSSGPIIPNGLFPIRIEGDVFRNGALFERNAFGFSVPAPTALNPPIDVAGYSHFPYFAAEADVFGPSGLSDFAGAYEYRLTARDVSGNGYNISVQFSVVPEPSGLTLLSLGSLGVVGYAWRLRRTAGVRDARSVE